MNNGPNACLYLRDRSHGSDDQDLQSEVDEPRFVVVVAAREWEEAGRIELLNSDIHILQSNHVTDPSSSTSLAETVAHGDLAKTNRRALF